MRRLTLKSLLWIFVFCLITISCQDNSESAPADAYQDDFHIEAGLRADATVDDRGGLKFDTGAQTGTDSGRAFDASEDIGGETKAATDASDSTDMGVDAGASRPDSGDGGTGENELGPVDEPNWHEGILPKVDPLGDGEVIREDSGRTLYGIPSSEHRFWVYLPDGYRAEEPSGILLFIHGSYDGDDDINPWFHNWEDAFGDENLVFIKMSFRDNSGTDDAHLQSTLYAIAKVSATYKILLGRGVLTGFSRGGHGISRLVQDFGGWPFNHILGESIIYQLPVPESVQPMSWTFSVGQLEWNSWELGGIATDRIQDLYSRVERGGSLDLSMNVIIGEGHDVSLSQSIIDPTVAAYRRSAAVYAPFVYRPDFEEPELQRVVDACQSMNLGHASHYLEEIIDSATNTSIQEKASRLKTLLSDRVDEMFEIIDHLKTEDPVLASHYASAGLYQLRGHPRRREMQDLMDTITNVSGFKAAQNATHKWYQDFPSYLDPEADRAVLLTDQIAGVQTIASEVEPSSLVGGMAADFLALN